MGVIGYERDIAPDTDAHPRRRLYRVPAWLSGTRGDDIIAADALASVDAAYVVEEYPDSRKEPSILILHNDRDGRPVHVMWGVPRNAGRPAILVTAYRPKPERWSNDFKRRIR